MCLFLVIIVGISDIIYSVVDLGVVSLCGWVVGVVVVVGLWVMLWLRLW